LSEGGIVAVKGIGGYHLACDARNPDAVQRLRERKYRKERPFALMASCIDRARELAELSAACEELLLSAARPIVLAPAKVDLCGVAPGNTELGILLPYAPLHHLLFAAGAPDPLVMTSANRSSEPIAYTDADALERLDGIADFFLIGERPIVRRVDDSVVRVGVLGPVILRRSRGYAPAVVSRLPTTKPILAVGADLKNAIALAVEGEVVISQHIGDLDNYAAREAFRTTIADLLRMYEVQCDELTVVHDTHPQYASGQFAMEFPCAARIAVQHHHAHIASVIAEREAWDRRVLGVSFDGTGYGDDGTIWGGEIFAGCVREGFIRVAHLRPSALAGGDAAAAHPVQAAAGFLAQLDRVPDLQFPRRYEDALRLVQRGVRTFTTSSVGRLFDAAAAILGFMRPVSFEGQAAMWLEQLARRSGPVEALPFPLVNDELDFRPLLGAVIDQKLRGLDTAAIARAFHAGLAQGLAVALGMLRQQYGSDTVALSGGVFQNELLLMHICDLLENDRLEIWTNRAVPANDGGICLGQAALAAMEIGRDA
jgi:hydrogenase maturation protein HypF